MVIRVSSRPFRGSPVAFRIPGGPPILSGPGRVAAAAIYIASILSGERRTQREVAGVTEVTIRNRCKELAERLDIDIVLRTDGHVPWGR